MFQEALEIVNAEERATFLSRACGSDEDLRRQVDSLIRAQNEACGFLPDQPSTEGSRAAWARLAEVGIRPNLQFRFTEKIGDWIGPYKLLEKIGEGGCGVVYMAEQRQPLQRKVAIKIIKLGMDTRSLMARFEAERQALALMDHPNIAKVLDAGSTETGRPFFVMELVRGIRITKFCDDHMLSTVDRLELLTQVCHAVQHAHQKGIIHRDLKPSNILVTEKDGRLTPKVIDFSIAKATGDLRLVDKTFFTSFDQLIGTPAYMSPEQAGLGKLDIDTRSDIYSLGVLLYELLTGRPPFDVLELRNAAIDEIRRMVREKDPLLPSAKVTTLEEQELTTIAKFRRTNPVALPRAIRGDLDHITIKCLEKDRSRRYESAAALAKDIKRYLDNEPVVARRPTFAYTLQKFIRRNRGAFAGGSAFILALFMGATLSTWQAWVANRAQLEAELSKANALKESAAARAAQRVAEDERRHAQDEHASSERHLYAANLGLLQHAWEQNHTPRARQLLEETSSYPGRGFEWFYWWQQTHQEEKTLRGHIGYVLGAAISPDGHLIATAGDDHTSRIWDAETGKEMIVLRGHAARVTSVAFSADSKWVITGSMDKTARIWDAASSAQQMLFEGHSTSITSVAFSSDDRTCATASLDGTTRVWSRVDGKELFTLRGHTDAVTSVAFSSDGRWLLTGSEDQSIILWDARTGKSHSRLNGHFGAIWSVAFSRDSERILAGNEIKTATVWGTQSATELFILPGNIAGIKGVAFSPIGDFIATGGEDNTVRVWNAFNGTPLLMLRGHDDWVRSVAFFPDGKRFVSASDDGTAKVWQTDGKSGPLELLGHFGPVWSIAFSQDGQRLVSSSSDNTAKVWDVATGVNLLTLRGHSGIVRAIAVSPNNKWVASASEDRTIKLWALDTGKELFSLNGHAAPISCLAFSPTSNQLITGSVDQSVKIWDLSARKELFRLKGHHGALVAVSFSHNGKWLLTGSTDGTAKVWDAVNGGDSLTLKGHTAGISSVAFSPDDSRIATGSDDTTAKIWDATTGKELLSLDAGNNVEIRAVAFSKDGQRVVTGSGFPSDILNGSEDQSTKVWDALSGLELLTLKSHGAAILCVALSPDGQRIATGSWNHSVEIWAVPSPEHVATREAEESVAKAALVEAKKKLAATIEKARVTREHDLGAINSWLLILPVPCANGGLAEGLEEEQIPHEALLDARPGELVKLDNLERFWIATETQDGVLDCERIFGTRAEHSITYAISYIYAQTNLSGLSLKVGSNSRAKVYLNGEEIYERQEVGPYMEDPKLVTGLGLLAGKNTLVFKMSTDTHGFRGSVRLIGANGGSVQGMRVNLNPPEAQLHK